MAREIPASWGQGAHLGVLAKPAQAQHGLSEAGQRSGAGAGTASTAFSTQQTAQVFGQVAGHVECGTIGNGTTPTGEIAFVLGQLHNTLCRDGQPLWTPDPPFSSDETGRVWSIGATFGPVAMMFYGVPFGGPDSDWELSGRFPKFFGG